MAPPIPPNPTPEEEPRYLVTDLPRKLSRAGFTCGTDELDTYFAKAVGQDIDADYCSCFVALDTHDNNSIAGYFTLSYSSILVDDIPEEQRVRLRNYPKVPCALMGRLAVATAHKGQGLGAALLFDAWTRTKTAKIGGVALVVDALDEKAEAFYLKHNFRRLVPKLQLWHPLRGLPPQAPPPPPPRGIKRIK